MSILVKNGATTECVLNFGNKYGENGISTWSNIKYPLVHTCDKKCRMYVAYVFIIKWFYLCKINDRLTYIALCEKFPKGNPIGTLIALLTARDNVGTERVFTPSVIPKLMYGMGVTVAA